MRSFVHDQPGIRVIFGIDSISRLADEVHRIGCSRAMVITSKNRREDGEQAARLLGVNAAGIFDGAAMHVPIEAAREACEAAKALSADCTVTIGGGSSVGFGKAIAREMGLPLVAIPTTYAGSEMTPVYGITSDGEKKTGRDPRVLPRTVIYDPMLTLKVPPHVSGTSGVNALAHCMAGILDENASPVVKLLANEGIRTLFRALPQVVSFPEDVEARSDALFGSWLAGSVLSSARLNVHYRICHALGGSFNLPHSDVHTVVLPHTVAFNTASPRDGQILYDLAKQIGAPLSLKEIGAREADLDRIAHQILQNVSYNPRPVDQEDVMHILENAFHGRRPS